MVRVIFHDGNYIPSMITDSPAAIWDEITGAVLSLGDVKELEPRLNKMRSIFAQKGLKSRASYLKLIELPLDQDLIDKVNSPKCKEYIKECFEDK